MTGYTKLFNSILTSTIWCGQDAETKVVWITMLAAADRNGLVDVTLPGLAKLAEVPVDKVRTVLDKLSSLDPDSRTLDNGGAKIKPLDHGWLLLNYKKYRNARVYEERKAYMRKYMREYMQKRREPQKLNAVRPDVKRNLAQAEAYTYNTSPPTPPSFVKPVKNTGFTKDEGVLDFQSPELKNHPRRCLMPECKGQARAGLPGMAALFCSEACYHRAKQIDPTNVK